MRSILCPVDFSADSRAALRYAATLVRNEDSRVVVLYVDDPLLAVAAATLPRARAIRAAGARALRSFVTRTLMAGPPVDVTLETVAGKPSREIVKAARRHQCDLIVMGYRGVGRASRWLFGSTTEGVVRTTAVPVVVIPPGFRRRTARTDKRLLRRAS